MNTAPTIDVIVPVYNVRDYLEKCVNSLLAQDFSDYVITLVDDGSTDDSGAICDALVQAHPERISVLHTENGGLSAARNRGAARSSAEYIVFIDSDDYAAPNYLSSLYDALTRFGTDMAIGTSMREYVSENGTVRDEMPDRLSDTCRLDRDTALRELLYEQYYSSYAWAKLIPRRLVLAHPFPVGKFFEDTPVLYKIVLDCASVAYVPDPCYHYLQRSGSIQHRPFTEKHKVLPYLCRDLLTDLQSKDVSAEVLQAAAYKLWRGFYVTLFHAASLPADRYLDVWRETVPLCREISAEVRRLPRMDAKQKVLMTLSLRFPRLFRLMARIKK